MLLTMKALTEGGRAFSTYVGQQLDLAKYAEDQEERSQAEALVALLTPVAKAFFTDTGLESCVLGQQVFGGHGYIREWGQEQLVRDVRIAQIYEGTNGIQALDLMGRKVVANGGLFLSIFSREVRAFAAGANAELAEFVTPLLTALDLLDNLTQGIVARAGNDPREIGAASVEYLHLFGYTAYAYLWARMAAAARRQREADPAFHDGKLATARFYFARILPRVHSLAAAVEAGSESLYGLEAEQF